MSEKSRYHQQDERTVRARLAGHANRGEMSGREPDARVAEAMAYAAKSLIEGVLEDKDQKPNNIAIYKLPSGEESLSDLPGVVTESGRNRPYVDMAINVSQAYELANGVQEKYYGDLTQAQEAVKASQDAAERAQGNI